MSTIAALVGPLLKWLILALWEVKEKNSECIEIESDPELERRFRNAERL